MLTERVRMLHNSLHLNKLPLLQTKIIKQDKVELGRGLVVVLAQGAQEQELAQVELGQVQLELVVLAQGAQERAQELGLAEGLPSPL